MFTLHVYEGRKFYIMYTVDAARHATVFVSKSRLPPLLKSRARVAGVYGIELTAEDFQHIKLRRSSLHATIRYRGTRYHYFFDKQREPVYHDDNPDSMPRDDGYWEQATGIIRQYFEALRDITQP